MAIAKTLSDFHKGGVAYNSFTPDNIVLSPFEGGDYVATLIDLSNARVVNNSAPSISPSLTFTISYSRQYIQRLVVSIPQDMVIRMVVLRDSV